jgi:ACT domain-containing protein
MVENDKTRELFLEQLRKNPIVQIACEKVGIGRATFYRWKKKSKTFARAVDEAIIEGRQIVNDLAEWSA